MGGLSFLRAELEALEHGDLLRQRPKVGDALVLCSNDYLGYAADPLDDPRAPTVVPPSGAGASRLVSGEHPAHVELERSLARWVGLEAALIFSSGYAANVGLLPALAGEADVIVSDELNHASIIDGCRLSRARVVVTPHLDLAAVERALAANATARRRFVVTESYFSMDGDAPPLAELRSLCDAYGAALIVDEAHALGVFGAGGRGRCWLEGVVPDVLVGTLGKAIGLQGAFVAGSPDLEAWLWNRARSFVFSTGIGPALAAAAVLRVERVLADDLGRARLDELASRLRSELRSMHAPLHGSTGPIVPIVVGDARRAVELRERLLAAGVYVQAIRPPTVPEGTSRLRVTLHARLSDAELERALGALRLVLAPRHR
ncbi:MAG: 8-amino-7-oxononanoate synthase [Deltaproteobacteria bacterium]|nr:8-amino-7-oxononanoate synthase [Deltaproteobacteria bacterium]